MAESTMISPEQFSRRVESAKLEKKAIYEVIMSASEEMVQAQTAKDNFIPGTAQTPESLRVQRISDLEAQNKKIAVVKATDFDRLKIVLGQDLAALAEKQRGLNDKIIKDSSVKPWEDPLLALANAFTLPWDKQELGTVQAKIESTQKVMTDINAHVQNSAKTIDATKESINAGVLASETEAVANLMKAKAIEAKIKAIQLRSNQIDEVLKMDSAQLEAYAKQKALDNDAARLALARASEARQATLMNMQIQKEKDAQAAEQQHLQFVNTALLAEGKQPLDINKLRVYQRGSGELIDTLTRQGINIAIAGPGSATHGPSILDRLKTEKAVGWRPDPNKPAQLAVKKMEFESIVRAEASSKDKGTKAINADADFAKSWRLEQENITSDSPFKLPAVATFASSKVITNNLIWQKYIAPTFSTGNTTDLKQPINEGLVFQAAATAVLDRAVTSAQAARFVADLFTTGVALNNEVNQFKKIAGMEQTMYGTRIQTGATGAFGTTAVNAMDISQITAAINKIVSSRLTSSLTRPSDIYDFPR